jgi:hypothetical protein
MFWMVDDRHAATAFYFLHQLSRSIHAGALSMRAAAFSAPK